MFHVTPKHVTLESWLNLGSLLFPKLALFMGRRQLGDTPDVNYDAQ